MLRLLVLAALVAGCASPDTEPAVVEPELAEVPAPPNLEDAAAVEGEDSLLLDGEGLRVLAPSTSTRLLAYGTPIEDVVGAVAAIEGEPVDRGTMAECGAGPIDYVRWPDGLTLHAQGGEFVGWALRDLEGERSSLSTMGGLALGTSRADLEGGPVTVEISETTLGEEFAAGEVYGLLGSLDADDEVASLWSGVSCNFR